jgi:hypothetical protein
MNNPQRLWWIQASSDHDMFERTRLLPVHHCHPLHYFQMATEKLGKAYFWRKGHAPPKTHTGFRQFLKALLDRQAELELIASTLGFSRGVDLEHWAIRAQELARRVERLAPAEAGEGPNPEYPWPHLVPTRCPAQHSFELWRSLTDSGQGRKLIDIVGRAIRDFGDYA